MRSSGSGNRDMLKCCYGYSNHGSRKPENPRKFSARTITKKIPDPFVFAVGSRLREQGWGHPELLCVTARLTRQENQNAPLSLSRL